MGLITVCSKVHFIYEVVLSPPRKHAPRVFNWCKMCFMGERIFFYRTRRAGRAFYFAIKARGKCIKKDKKEL